MYRKMMMFLAVMLMCVGVFSKDREFKEGIDFIKAGENRAPSTVNGILRLRKITRKDLLKYNPEWEIRDDDKLYKKGGKVLQKGDVIWLVDANNKKNDESEGDRDANNDGTKKKRNGGNNTVNEPTKDSSETQESEESSLWFLWLMLGLAGGFVIGKKGFKNLVRNKNTGNYKDVGNAAQIGNLMSQDELEKLRTENERLKKENERLTTDNKKLSAENKNLRQDKKDLLDENVELGEKIDATKSYGYAQSHGADNKSQQQNQHSTSGRLYAMAIIDGCLYRVSETPIEETIFELRQRGESRADVDIYRSAHEKILADVNYLDGCDKQVVGNSPVSVNVESLGEAVKDQDGFWRVTKKPNVIVR